MTDMRRGAAAEARIHQQQQQLHHPLQQQQQPAPLKQASLCESYRSASSRSSTPTELKAYSGPGEGQPPPVNGGHHAGNNNYCLHLHSLESNANMGGSLTGSTTSSTTATAPASVAYQGRYSNGGGGSQGAPCEIQFDEREIYYVSPTKRKGAVSSSYPYPAAATPARSNLRSGGDRLRSFSPTTVAPTYPALAPTPAYTLRNGQEFGYDSSHLSDAAMQVLRSGSSDLRGSLMRSTANSHNASSGNLAQQHAAPGQRMQPQSVTFSKTPPQTQTPRGSLRRSKGRSNQSLCSCDAGADTDINPDPARPLYQYSLERRPKSHTYTCEQNAQILMRLERERQSSRKLSLVGGGGAEAAEAAKADTSQMDDNDTSDLDDDDDDDIPPVPPPPAMKRNSSLRSLRLLHFAAATSNHSPVPSTAAVAASDNNNSGTFCAGNELDIGSLLDDCTSSILKCANAMGSELMAAAAGGTSDSHVTATLATMAANAKPDVCHVGGGGGGNQETSFYNSRQLRHQKQQPQQQLPLEEDIFSPATKKSDPSLCFLHYGPNGVGPGPAPFIGELTKSQRDLQSTCSLLGLSKYSTIAASNSHSYARQLSQYAAEQQPQRCRCMSQSQTLAGGASSREYLHQAGSGSGGTGGSRRQQQQQQQRGDNHKQRIFHMGDDHEWLHGHGPPPPPMLSRSFSNLMDMDAGSRVPYHKFATPPNGFGVGGGSSCSFGTAANLLNGSSFTTLNSNCSSGVGLKDKYQSQQHPHRHGDHLTAPDQQQQKEQQLHSSVTSIMPWKHRQCPSRGSSSSGTNSFRFDVAKHWLAVSSILLIIGAASVAVPLALRVAASAPFEERLRVALQLLDQVPLIDGHNDLPWNIRKFLHNKLTDFKFDEDLRNVMPWARSNWSHTDLTRLKKGRISAQFWAAYVPCEAQHRDAVQLTLEQIDVIKRLTERYSPQLTTCTSSDEILEAHKNHQLCSLTGVEGGHSLGGSLAVLRTLYAIGVRYMTLTSTCHTPWADSSYADAPTYNVKHGGLTIFGKTIIREMNRLGMMVDLSHVSTGTMRDALEVSEAPVIFSHSSAYELCNSSRNVQDDMLRSLAKNGGLVMVNFYSKFLSCSDNSTVADAVAHINHIKRVAGIDHVGLGAGYDGINFTPKGLEDVSSYPTLFAELLGVGWSIEDLTKLAGGNFLRVMQQVEKLRDEKRQAGVKPFEDHPNFKADDPYNCTSS